jgi:hypothetical protein
MMKRPNQKVSPELQIEIDKDVPAIRLRLNSAGIFLSDDAITIMVLLKKLDDQNKALQTMLDEEKEEIK